MDWVEIYTETKFGNLQHRRIFLQECYRQLQEIELTCPNRLSPFLLAQYMMDVIQFGDNREETEMPRMKRLCSQAMENWEDIKKLKPNADVNQLRMFF